MDHPEECLIIGFSTLGVSQVQVKHGSAFPNQWVVSGFSGPKAVCSTHQRAAGVVEGE